MHRLFIALLFACVTLLLSVSAAQGGFSEQFTDTLDGSFDASGWLSKRYGFIPVVSIITEPAIGPGAAVGLGFLHRAQEDLGKPITSPPSVSGVFGLALNDTIPAIPQQSML